MAGLPKASPSDISKQTLVVQLSENAYPRALQDLMSNPTTTFCHSDAGHAPRVVIRRAWSCVSLYKYHTDKLHRYMINHCRRGARSDEANVV